MASSTPVMNIDNKELLNLITATLPNLGNYIKIVLKREKLSDEAESMRKRYDSILSSLEQGLIPGGRPLSIVGDDDSGYYSANRIRVVDLSEQIKQPSPQSHSGYLLWQDEKLRWRRCWCRAEYRDAVFFIYEDSNEEILLRSFSLDNTFTKVDGQLETERDNCFVISGAVFDGGVGTTSTDVDLGVSPVDVYLAAYTESERRKWTDVLHLVSSIRDSGRLSLATLDGHPWLAPAFLSATESTSSSSNFSSNRDSIISNTSSLVNNAHRMSSRTENGEGVKDLALLDESKTLSFAKQQQPLPPPPSQLQHQQSQVSVTDSVDTLGQDSTSVSNCQGDEDTASVGTIYESIDNLVIQFDNAIRQIGENMRSGDGEAMGKKKKERSIFKQHSFLLSRNKSSKSKLLTEKKAELEKGERYSGYMMRKTNNGSWKKRWCVLKGCVFGYYKSQNDTQGHEYVILNGNVEEVQEGKKKFTFCLHCKGVPDMHFSMDDEETCRNWLEKLRAACNSATEYIDVLKAGSNDSVQNIMQESTKFADSIYSVPRALPQGGGDEIYDIPRGSLALPSPMSAEAAIDAGIYNVPRALMEDTGPAEEKDPLKAQYLLGENPFNIYNYPRTSMSPDEEGIYDDPLDIIDMEIYDYPPDASELGIYDSEYNSQRNSSVSAASSDLILSEGGPNEHWKTLSVPPVPNSSRPAIPVASNVEDYPTPHNSAMSEENLYDHPRPLSANVASEAHLSVIGEDSFSDGIPMDLPDSSLDYGQCALRGYLYKKERFMTWVKHYCIIRNNFLECHKHQALGSSYCPTLKLFLPRSEVSEGGSDAKKKWAFQVKHPRREGVLTFAAENEEEYHRWIKAFQAGASIQVQPVNTVDEIRITDLDMQKRWTTSDGNGTDHIITTSEITPDLPPRGSTFSAGSSSEDYYSDTLKRRKKFSWVKSNFMRRRSEKKMSGSQTELNSQRFSNTSFDVNLDTTRSPHFPDPLRKSVSLELLPSGIEDQEMYHSRTTVASDGSESMHGYLRVQRKGADNTWVRYWCILEHFQLSCYISQRDLTLTLSIQLQGSRISYAETECYRPHSFKISHPESGQCLFLAAEDNEEFFKWFSEVTRGGRQVISDESSVNNGPFVSFYEIPTDLRATELSHRSILSEDDNSSVSETSSMTSFQPSSEGSQHNGILLKASHSGKWKKRYCLVKEGFLHIYRSSAEKDPIVSLPLHSCSLELISISQSCQYPCQFKLNPAKMGKSHTFAAFTESDMYNWISTLRRASSDKVSTLGGNGDEGAAGNSGTLTRKKSKKLKDADLITYVPVSSISTPDYAGFAYLQFGEEPWTQFWCVAYSNCLYIYQNQAATATVKTVVLPGYEIKVGDLHSTKYANNLVLKHEGISPVWMAVHDKDELEKWAKTFERYTRAEGSAKQRKISGKLLPDETSKLLSHKPSSKVFTGPLMKGPVRADHAINTKKRTKQDDHISIESNQVPHSKQLESRKRIQQSIIHRYEKRIRKTHKVANQTELKLKKQQTSLLHFKKELSRHLVKLEELSSSGNEHAQKRLKSIQKKIAQVDKIVPYLEKYVSVNRQAEMQTIAVLKESCTMELQQHSHSTSDVPVTNSSQKLDMKIIVNDVSENTSSVFMPPDTSLSPQLVKEDSLHSVCLISENPYASLSDVRKEVADSCLKVPSNYAELNFPPTQKATAIRPPSVNYSEVRIIPNRECILEVPDSCSKPTEIELQSTPKPSSHHQLLDPNFVVPLESYECEVSQSNSLLHDTTLTPEYVGCNSNDSTLRAQTTFAELSVLREVNDFKDTASALSSDHESSVDIPTLTRNLTIPPPPPPRSDSIQVQESLSSVSSSEQEQGKKTLDNILQVDVNGTSGLGSLERVPSVMDRVKALQRS